MTARARSVLLAGAAALLASGGTRAQPAPAEALAEAPPRDCGPKATLYTGEKDAKLWVLRRGSVLTENPLRPLGKEELLVLEVAVNGRIATAFGPSVTALRQGGAPSELERETGGTIRWAPDRDAMPPGLRIVAEDGRVLQPHLAYGGCADPPPVRAAPAPRRPARPAPAAGERPARPPVALPQGALPGFELR